MIEVITQRQTPVDPSTTGGRVYQIFSDEPRLTAIAVVDERNRPIGLVSRSDFLVRIGQRFGWSLFERRPVTFVMDAAPLIVPRTASFAEVAEALNSKRQIALEGFIVVDEAGGYYGIGDGAGLIQGMLVEQKAAADRLAGFNQELDALLRLAAAPDASVARVVRAAVEAMSRGLDVSLASVWLFDRSGRGLRCVEAFCQRRKHLDLGAIDLADLGAYAEVIRQHRVVAVTDTQSDPRVRNLAGYLASKNVTSMLDAQIPAGGRSAGIVGCDSIGRMRRWGSDEIAFAASVAALVGQSILAEQLAAERSLLEARVEERTAQHRVALRRAEAANVAKSQFIATVSHELRTPLNAIIGYTEMMHEEAEENGYTVSLPDHERVLTAARRLLRLINGILDLSKIEAGRMELETAPASVRSILHEALDTVRTQAEANGNRLLLTAPAADETIVTDAFKLSQCLINLLSNAAKFTKNGEIELTAAVRGDSLIFAVRDTGIGIPEDKLKELFQPFTQVDASTTRRYGGTGLGLAVTRRLAQALGGDVSVTSELGVGSVFTLETPKRAVGQPLPTPAPVEAEVDGADEAPKGPVILVIEDDPTAQDLAERGLRRVGLHVIAARTAEAGLAALEARRPALVVLDLNLPDKSGVLVLQEMQARGWLQSVPVLVVSADDNRAASLALGACDHLVKPVDRDRLAASVLRYARLPAPAIEEAGAAATAASG